MHSARCRDHPTRSRASFPYARPNAVSTFLAWRGSKRSTSRRVLPFEKSDLQVPHEPGGGQPEIIPHQHNRLDMLAIACRRAATSSVFSSPRLAWSHCSNWSRTSSTLRSGGRTRPFRNFASESTSPNPRRQFRTDLAQALEQPGFRLLRGRLDVNRQGRACPAGAEVPP